MAEKSDKNNIHSGHRKRVKAKVAEYGYYHLEDHRLLELLLFYSIPQADTNEIAHNLINEFGSLQDVFKADVSRLCRVKGVGENTAILIGAIGETLKRTSKKAVDKRRSLKSSDSLMEMVASGFKGETKEKVMLFCLDGAHRLKKSVVVCEGTQNESFIDVRRAVQAAMDCDAVSAFIAHNHPESTCEPSASDVDSTRALCVMFRKLGFSLIDHIIVGSDGGTYSMRSDPMFTQMFY
ncbi:MAG: RadC family protein [Clostridia bacterium]|nr:RadC family protein [Clostridia bacterium]